MPTLDDMPWLRGGDTGFLSGVQTGSSLASSALQNQARRQQMEQAAARFPIEMEAEKLKQQVAGKQLLVTGLTLEKAQRDNADEIAGVSEISDKLKELDTAEKRLQVGMPAFATQTARHRWLEITKEDATSNAAKARDEHYKAKLVYDSNVLKADASAMAAGLPSAVKFVDDKMAVDPVMFNMNMTALKEREAKRNAPTPGFVTVSEHYDSKGNLIRKLGPDPSKREPLVKMVKGPNGEDIPYVGTGPESWSPLAKHPDKPQVWTDEKGREWVNRGVNNWQLQKETPEPMVTVKTGKEPLTVTRKIKESVFEQQEREKDRKELDALLAKQEKGKEWLSLGLNSEEKKRLKELQEKVGDSTPAAPATQPKAGGEEKVVVEKDGKKYRLPKSQVEDAKKQGYKLSQ